MDEQNQEPIGEILEITTNTSVADSFNQRKKEIGGNLKYWLGGFIISILILIGGISTLVWLAYDKNGLHIDEWKF